MADSERKRPSFTLPEATYAVLRNLTARFEEADFSLDANGLSISGRKITGEAAGPKAEIVMLTVTAADLGNRFHDLLSVCGSLSMDGQRAKMWIKIPTLPASSRQPFENLKLVAYGADGQKKTSLYRYLENGDERMYPRETDLPERIDFLASVFRVTNWVMVTMAQFERGEEIGSFDPRTFLAPVAAG